MLFLVLLLALVLRLVNINQGYWLDEAIGVIAANEFSYRGLMTEFVKYDFHPPLYYVLLKLWSDFFGYREISVRLLSVLFGTLTVFLIYAIAKELETRKKKDNFWNWPLVSAALMATAPLHIYYSQEARMYSLAAFAASLAIYFFIRVLKQSNFFDWAAFSISLIFLAASDYVPLFLFPVFWIAPLLLRKNTRWFFNLGLAHFPLALIAFFWLPIFRDQASGGKYVVETLPGWKKIAGGANLKQAALVWIKFSIGRISFLNKIVYMSVVSLVSVPILFSFWFALKKRDKKVLILWLWLLVPLVTAFLFSLFTPVFNYFRFLFILPAFYLLISWGVFNWPRYGKILAVVILGLNLGFWGIYAFNKNYHREDWIGAVSLVEGKAEKSDIVLFEFSEPFAPYRWYSSGKVPAAGAFSSIKGKSGDEERIKDLVENKEGVYHFVYLRELSDPEKILGNTLFNEGFIQSKVYDFRGVGHVIYWKKAK